MILQIINNGKSASPVQHPSSWHYAAVHSLRIDKGSTWHRYFYSHTAIMLDLSPLCYYEYQVGNGHLWSKVYAFRGITPGTPAENAMTYQMLVLGDLGNYDQSEESLAMFLRILEAEEFLAFAHLGDIA